MYTAWHLPLVITTCGFGNILGICGAIRSASNVPFIEKFMLAEVCIIAPFIALTLLNCGAKVHANSQELCMELQRSSSLVSSNRKLEQKLSASLREIGTSMRPLKVLTYNSVTGYFVHTSNICVSILASFPSM